MSRPAGIPRREHFTIQVSPLLRPESGQFLVRNLYLSVDPVQRGWTANPELTPLGHPMRALAVGVVIDSRHPQIATGDVVYGFLGWQDYAVATIADLLSHVPQPRMPLSTYAGVLGMPGVTAWLALHDLAPPAGEDTMLVSTAAGTVGSIVGQIGRARGARVTGLTGSAEKVTLCLDRYGYHQAFDYHDEQLASLLESAAPHGFSIYFDNTGGGISDRAIRVMAKHGRIIQCGTAATPSWSPPPLGWRPEREVLTRVLTWTGFYIFDHVARFQLAIDQLSDMMARGELLYDEAVEAGIDRLPGALERLFEGRNLGKMLVYVGDD